MKQEKEMCLAWWFIILFLITFWTLLAVWAFANDLDDFERDAHQRYIQSQKHNREGEVTIRMDDDGYTGRMTIYDEYGRNPTDYRIRSRGDGRYHIEEE